MTGKWAADGQRRYRVTVKLSGSEMELLERVARLHEASMSETIRALVASEAAALTGRRLNWPGAGASGGQTNLQRLHPQSDPISIGDRLRTD